MSDGFIVFVLPAVFPREFIRIDNDREHIIENGVIVMISFRAAGFATREGASQQFIDQVHAVPFVLSHGSDGPPRFDEHGLGIVGRLTSAIKKNAIWQRFAFVVRYAHLAHGNHAGGKVNHYRWVVVRGWQGAAIGVG